jgi:hypothetical protein
MMARRRLEKFKHSQEVMVVVKRRIGLLCFARKENRATIQTNCNWQRFGKRYYVLEPENICVQKSHLFLRSLNPKRCYFSASPADPPVEPPQVAAFDFHQALLILVSSHKDPIIPSV